MPGTNAFRDSLALAAIGGAGYVPYSNANAYIGVGISSAAFAATQTDLQGATKTRKGMDATYPTIAGNVITFRSTFGTADANHAWQEFGVFNAATGGTMMNRTVADNGTKAATETKVFTVTITMGIS
jgi:hypothetical protein